MKYAKKYIVIHCAILLAIFISMRMVRNQVYSVLVYLIAGLAGGMTGCVEDTRFQNFIRNKYPLVYCEYKSYKGNKRMWLHDYAEDHSRKDTTDDPVLLDNCRRYIICCHATIAFVFGLFLAMVFTFIY